MAPALAIRIMNFSGQVQLQSQGSSGFRTARRGMSLNLGDRLRTGSQAWVELQCGDLRTVWRLGSEGAVLVSSRRPATTSRVLAGRSLGGANPDIRQTLTTSIDGPATPIHSREPRTPLSENQTPFLTPHQRRGHNVGVDCSLVGVDAAS